MKLSKSIWHSTLNFIKIAFPSAKEVRKVIGKDLGLSFTTKETNYTIIGEGLSFLEDGLKTFLQIKLTEVTIKKEEKRFHIIITLDYYEKGAK